MIRKCTSPEAGVAGISSAVCHVQVPLRMSVDQISFSAHADYAQTEGFIKALQPAHVVCWRLS